MAGPAVGRSRTGRPGETEIAAYACRRSPGASADAGSIPAASTRFRANEPTSRRLYRWSLSARSADQSLRYGRWMTTVAGSGIVRLSEAPTRSSVAGSTPAELVEPNPFVVLSAI